MWKHWIPVDKINLLCLCRNENPQAIYLLTETQLLYPGHLIRLDWYRLSTNPSAMDLLRAYPQRIEWRSLSENPSAIYLLSKAIEETPEKINWSRFSANPSAIDLIQSHMEKVDWIGLSSNPHPTAITLLQENPHKINWYRLSSNPQAISIIEQHLDRVDWNRLSLNPSAIHLLEEEYRSNPEYCRINWNVFSENSAIFDDEPTGMK